VDARHKAGHDEFNNAGLISWLVFSVRLRTRHFFRRKEIAVTTENVIGAPPCLRRKNLTELSATRNQSPQERTAALRCDV
jgi:hypothetical protein